MGKFLSTRNPIEIIVTGAYLRKRGRLERHLIFGARMAYISELRSKLVVSNIFNRFKYTFIKR